MATVHDVSAAFNTNPVNYLRTHACQLGGYKASATRQGAYPMPDPRYYSADLRSFNKATSGSTWNYVAQPAATLSVAAETGWVNNVTRLFIHEATGTVGASYLPWYPNTCTVTQVRADSDLCFTGPLSGCHIYVLERGGFEPYLMHANANDTNASVEENKNAKVNMMKVARHTGALAGFRVTRQLERDEYGGEAFVWGWRGATGWEWYVHDLRTDRSKVSAFFKGRFDNRPLRAA